MIKYRDADEYIRVCYTSKTGRPICHNGVIVKVGVTAIFLQGLFRSENNPGLRYRIPIASIIEIKKNFEHQGDETW